MATWPRWHLVPPVLQMAEVLQVEFSGVLGQIDGVYILEEQQLRHVCYLEKYDESLWVIQILHGADEI